MKKLMMSITILVAMICAFAFNAQAAPIYGFTSFSGTFEYNNASLASATEFTNFTNVVVSTGGGTVDYSAIPGGTSVNLSSFTFEPDVGDDKNPEIANIWEIQYDSVTYSYKFSTSEILLRNVNQLSLRGTGIASITGYDDTESEWFWSATGSGQNSTFALSTKVPPEYQPPGAIPEPTTMVLFGLGLLGCAGLTRKMS